MQKYMQHKWTTCEATQNHCKNKGWFFRIYFAYFYSGISDRIFVAFSDRICLVFFFKSSFTWVSLDKVMHNPEGWGKSKNDWNHQPVVDYWLWFMIQLCNLFLHQQKLTCQPANQLWLSTRLISILALLTVVAEHRMIHHCGIWLLKAKSKSLPLWSMFTYKLLHYCTWIYWYLIPQYMFHMQFQSTIDH